MSSVEERLAKIEEAIGKDTSADKQTIKQLKFTAASSKFVADPTIKSAQIFLKEIEAASEESGQEVLGTTTTVSTVTTVTI